ncbi:MAG: aromatic amino acid ammonia-lyase [Pseudomonadota bacterium]
MDAARIDIDQANAIVEGRLQVALSSTTQARCRDAHSRLHTAITERRHIYGVTTGFGPLANRLVNPDDSARLQNNLVNHLATGLGTRLPWDEARAIVLSRLISISKGYSGASEPTITALLALLNSPLAPHIPSRGTVGASGDLTPLAHMVRALQGDALFFDRQGTEYEGENALAQLDIAPLSLGNRDGLALVNGTSAMTGIALRNTGRTQSCLAWMIKLTAALAEVMGARVEAWSPILAEIRDHPGQIAVTRALNKAIAQSGRMIATPIAARRLDDGDFTTEAHPGQDAYSLRCAPQVIGAVLDAVTWHDTIVVRELNAVTDNPVFPPGSDCAAIHGGNFMGQPIALASDALANALTVLAGLAERQLARLTDETMNGDLSPFLHGSTAGLNSGFMGAQVTATATLAEMRSQGSVSSQSISTNAANQDVVSMGTIAARKAADATQYTAEILAILALATAQAIDLSQEAGGGAFSPDALETKSQIRRHAARLGEDRPLSAEIAAMARVIRGDQAIC